MNRVLCALAGVAALTLLSACGEALPSEAEPAAAAATQEPSALAAAYDACDPTAIAEQYVESDVARSHWGIVKIASKDMGITTDEFSEIAATEALTYTPAEDTLVADGAYRQLDSGELNPTGAIAGMMYECAINELDVPERVSSHIASTRALDGTLEDSWNDLHARWSYHPGSGLNITLWADSE